MSASKKFIKIIKFVPSVDRYLSEKVAMQSSLLSKADEIAQAHQDIENLKTEINLLKGIVPGATEIGWPVRKADLITARPDKNKALSAKPLHKKRSLKILWVLPPMGKSSGGHTSILRAIAFLESKGHENVIYIYDAMGQSSLQEVQTNMQYYPNVKAIIHYNSQNMENCDALFATNWFTAYPVFNYDKPAKKYYFVQDFEPLFEAAGSYNTLAENTYKFGFHGVTIGDWLKQKLTNDYGMKCDSFPFGVNIEEYNLKNQENRQDVFFYARPVTPRRGFELGILALEVFYKQNPDITIHMVGWDVGNFKITFPYENHGILETAELNDLYNKCAAGLVLSFTNMSLLPLEMLSSGCIPVVNDAEHTRMVPYSNHIEYVPPNPSAIAAGLERSIKRRPNVKVLSKIAAEFAWDASFENIETMLTTDVSWKIKQTGSKK